MAEKEYIERGAVVAFLENMAASRYLIQCVESKEKFPAADVVEVVRCKDCKHWVEYGEDPILENKCEECHRSLGEDGGFAETCDKDYCSFGAKMDGKGEGECE